MLSDGPNCIHGRCAIDERGIEQVAATFPIEQVIALQRSDIGDDGSRPRYYRCVLDNLAPHH
jgi:hypothetical protein